MSDKLSISQVKKLPYATLNRLITKAKQHLKKDETWQRICKEYNQEVDIIDLIPTMFSDLDVSAKTNHGIIILNYKLLTDGDFFKDYGYLIHEYTHWFQQCFGDKPTQGSDEGSYLDNKFEQEGFANQIEYMADEFGKEEAEKYVDHLLDYHDVKKKNKRDELESILLDKVD